MYGYEDLIDLIWLENLRMQAEYWFLTQVLVWTTLVQLAVCAVGIGGALLLSRVVDRWLGHWASRLRVNEKTGRYLLGIARSLNVPLLIVIMLVIVRALARELEWPAIVLTTLINLTLVWVAIRFASWAIPDERWSRIVAFIAFAVATLDTIDMLQPTVLYLGTVGFHIGNSFVSMLEVIKGAISLVVLLWIAVMVSRLLKQRIHRSKSLTPSLKLLTVKLVKLGLICIAVLIALNGIGIDLTALAVFTGAVGVGIGFGIQRPVSNLICGVILLLDRSIKPGDVVELSGPGGERGHTFGWVTSLNARYASLTTRDGTEWLIPNEDFITQRVVNWSYKNDHLRLLTPFAVAYDCDVRMAIRLAVEAAKENPRVMRDPAPVCRLMGFGDGAINLELRTWITDPVNGVINVRSEILLAMWDRYREHGIRIPFAQRELHLKDGANVTVTIDRTRAAAAEAPAE
ncbi:MAG: mechanosensitive ion channel [Rhodospirillaceae bacterium]|nr:mechanosensitive ion channel [Rhodospirillaceae bacterium]